MSYQKASSLPLLMAAGVQTIQYAIADGVKAWIEPSTVDNSITKWEYIQLSELNGTVAQNNGIPTNGSRFTFRFNALEGYYLPSQAYLSVLFTIAANNALGTALTAPGCAIVNDAAPLFSTLQITIGDQVVEVCPNDLGHHRIITDMLEYSTDDQGSFLQRGWAPDSGIPTGALSATISAGMGQLFDQVITATLTGGPPATGATITQAENLSYNDGYKRRYDYLSTQAANNAGALCELILPLNRLSDVLQGCPKLLSGVPFQLDLTTGAFSSCLIQCPSAPANPLVMQMKNMFLYMPSVQLTPSLDAELKQQFLSWQASNHIVRQPYLRRQIFTYSLPSITQWTQIVSTFAKPITRVLVGFKLSSQVSGANQLVNPMTWVPPGSLTVSNCYLTYGSKTIPQNQYRPSVWGNGQILQTLQAMENRQEDMEGGSCFSSQEWMSGCSTLYPFDVRYSTDYGTAASTNQDLNLYFTFTAATPANCVAYVWVESLDEISFSFADCKTIARSS
jgi:hypothetical protein